MNPAKTVEESRTTQIHILMPADSNGFGRMFGGKLMEWIDVVAAVTARRHAEANVTTAAVDHLEFLSAAHVNDTLVLEGRLTWVGNSSMEVRVDTFVEALNGARRRVNRAYLVLVALDGKESPVRVPRLRLTTPEEEEEWDAALRRKAVRDAFRQK